MILGGCGVSPSDESGIPKNIDELDNQLQAASQHLEECYELERAEAQVAGMVLESEADYRGWKELARLGAQAAAGRPQINRHAHVLEGRQGRDELEVLEYKSDVGVAHAGAPVLVEAV